MTKRKRFHRSVYLGILKRYRCRCAKCGIRPASIRDVEFDHVLDLWLGGKDEPDNLRPLCVACHKLETIKAAKARAKIARIQKKQAGLPARAKLSKTVGGKVLDTRRGGLPWETADGFTSPVMRKLKPR